MIAIKHLEEALGGKVGSDLPAEEEIRSALLQNPKYYEFIADNKTKRDKKTLNRKGSNLLGQIKRFANDIKAGDLIVTKNEEDGYNIGICTDSNAFIDHGHVELPREGGEAPKGAVLRYKLRKKVAWGPSINGVNLPHAVRRATRGQQTISNLSSHRVKIFHLIYPFFTDGENLYFSSKIKKQGDINALVVGKLFENVSLAKDIIDALMSDSEISLEDISSKLSEIIFSGESFVTCQAEFMSPGDMWCKIPLLQAKELVPQIAAGVIACLLLTGQVEAAQLNNIGENGTEPVAEVKTNEDSPSAEMFKDKFNAAKPSVELKGIAQKLKKKAKELKSLESQRSTRGVQENLKIGLASAETKRLEQFSYGINVIELRGLYENN